MGFPMAELFVVTANRTDDGAVRYLRVDRTWTSDLAEAYLCEDATERDALVAWAEGQQRDVCDPYFIRVARTESGLDPLSTRERIRAGGPVPVLRQWGYVA